MGQRPSHRWTRRAALPRYVVASLREDDYPQVLHEGFLTMIEATGLTKRYGDRLAVDSLTFTVKPGQVTGFLGPNGAGKSTTMRMILGPGRAHRRGA